VHHCPHDQGDYVWIYGGPYDTREVIDDQFPNAPDEVREAAAEFLESGAYNADDDGIGCPCDRWSGVPSADWGGR
jgi:hypothetical protein